MRLTPETGARDKEQRAELCLGQHSTTRPCWNLQQDTILAASHTFIVPQSPSESPICLIGSIHLPDVRAILSLDKDPLPKSYQLPDLNSPDLGSSFDRASYIDSKS